MREIEVRGCWDCRFAADYQGCRLDAPEPVVENHGRDIGVYGENESPDWCPLRSGPVVVKLEK